MVRLALLTVLASTWVMANAGFAAPPPDAKKVETAKRYVDAGIAAQQAGDYETAIALFSKAYGLVPNPILIFNMAQAARLAGHEDQAIDLYKQYLDADPNGPETSKVKEIISAYEAKQAAAAQTKATDQAAVDQAAALKAAEDKGRIEQAQADLARQAERQERQPQPQPQQSQPPAQEPSEGHSSLRIAGIATGVVGIAGLGMGIGFGLHARSLANDLSQPGTVYDPDTDSSGKNANHIAIASYVVGGVLLATGVTLFALGSRHGHGDTHSVSVVPAIFSGGGGLAVAGYLR